MRQETRSRASRPDVGGVDDGEREGRGSAEAGKREGAIGYVSLRLGAHMPPHPSHCAIVAAFRAYPTTILHEVLTGTIVTHSLRLSSETPRQSRPTSDKAVNGICGQIDSTPSPLSGSSKVLEV
ncbi:hypothetical protein GGX14DRAFT_403515 [Mycena pura]|uniref:Uncharacterized protein n=1 Tax=Mycena pura TaxID=153505 RepID=A0AAD6Y662_9AGAR|nr:hypothetical protein GGX14DRAFT_403515 [Mycena pura]